MTRSYDIVVVGAGLMGSAAAKYLADKALDVCVVGAPAGSRIFSSHDDEGRITRVLDRDEFWADIAKASINRYAVIEEESGIRFHTPSGFLRVGPAAIIDRAEALARDFSVEVARHPSGDLKSVFPYFGFDDGDDGLLETGRAGHINPKALVRAQLTIARRRGATVISDVVRSIRSLGHRQGEFEVVCDSVRLASRSVLVAAGAWTHLMALTPAPLPVTVKTETVILIPIKPDELVGFKSMPSLWYDFDWHPVCPHAYLVPPIRYPDGRYYIKLGSDNDRDVEPDSPEHVAGYFESGGSLETAAALREIAARILPGLDSRVVKQKPCILTYSADRHPILGEVAPGWFVATGGNGASAKSSDEIGRRAAALVAGELST